MSTTTPAACHFNIVMPITEVKMIHAGPWGKLGTLVPVDVSVEDTKTDIKRKLGEVTGIPQEHVKIMLGAFCQLVASDKRAESLKYGTCGVTEGLGLVVEAARAGQKPHIPNKTANRIDNSGTWGEGDRD